MSGAGMNPLALAAMSGNPDAGSLYAQQLAIQQRQALAQGLLQQGMGEPGRAAYGGLRNAGNAILGAYLARGANRDTAAMYSPDQGQSQATPQAQQMAAQLNPPQPGATSSGTPDPSAQPGPYTQASNMPSGGMSQPIGQGGQGGQMGQPQGMPPQQQQGQPQVGQSPMARAMNGVIQNLPNQTPQQSMLQFYGNNAEYWKALNTSKALTDPEKQAIAAFPNDPQRQMQALQGIVNKAGSQPITRGMVIMPDGTKVFAPPPAPAGHQYITGTDGNTYLVPMAGGMDAVANTAQSGAVGTARGTGDVGYTADGMPVGTNTAALHGLQMPGQNNAPPQQYQQPAPGAIQDAQNQFQSVLNSPVQMTSGFRSPGHNVAVGGVPNSAHMSGEAYDFVPQGMSVTDAAAKLKASGIPYAQVLAEGDHVHVAFPNQSQPIAKQSSQPSGSSALLPQLPAGQKPYMEKLGGEAADRYGETVNAAAGSPLRVNILDNIMNLSKQGVATGPTQEWQNHLYGTVSAMPGFSQFVDKLSPDTKNNLSKFQIMQKFMLNSASQAWQSAGGTQTDKQFDILSHAVPNTEQFPQAVQAVTNWFRAGEMALQAKANYQSQALGPNGGTPGQQAQAEATWRNVYDPRVFQLNQIPDLQGKVAFIKENGWSKQDLDQIGKKTVALKNLGAIQ
jgi:hypothetical protein